jgi:hypothetical protein
LRISDGPSGGPIHRIGVGGDGIELIARAEREHGPAGARRAAIETQLVVPVRQRDFLAREADEQAWIAIAAGDRRGRTERADRLAHQAADLQQVRVEV